MEAKLTPRALLTPSLFRLLFHPGRAGSGEVSITATSTTFPARERDSDDADDDPVVEKKPVILDLCPYLSGSNATIAFSSSSSLLDRSSLARLRA